MWTGKESRGGEEKLALFDSLTFLPIESVASYCTAVNDLWTIQRSSEISH